MMSNCNVDKCPLTLLTVSEALELPVLKVKLEMQTLKSVNVLFTNAYRDKSLSNTVFDFSLTKWFVPICNIIFFGHFFDIGLT